MKIKEIHLKNYKSIKDSKFEASDFNVLIGKNNSGKSAVLDALRSYTGELTRNSNSGFTKKEVYAKDESNEIEFSIELKFSEEERREIYKQISRHVSKEVFEDISSFKHIIRYEPGEGIYQQYQIKYAGDLIDILENESKNGSTQAALDWRNFPNQTNYRRHTSFPPAFESVVKSSIGTLDYLEAFREAEDMRSVNHSVTLQNSGENLTNTFDTIYRNKPEKFEEIKEEFIEIMEGVNGLRSIMTERNDTTVFVEEEILEDGFRLNEISSGSKQILILITKLVLSQDKRDFLLLEEPELHLHPEAQKQMFRLIDRVSNQQPQVFATSHSREFIEESSSSNVIKIEREKNSEIHTVNEGEIQKEFQDLGYERGNLLQSNAVMFVEGMSDKLILKEFGRKLDKDLEEHGISVIELEGKENMKRDGRSLVKLLYSFNIPYMFLIDKDDHNNKEAAEGEIVESIKREDDEGWWETEWENFCSLEKYSIESYLIDKSAVAQELDENPEKVEEKLEGLSDNKDKSEVLQEIYQKFLGLDYNKDRDGLKIAKRMENTDIDSEIDDIITQIIEKSKT